MKQEKPNMKHIISYSGGLGSAITADFVCKQYGKENVILLFADTLIEDKDLYRFNEDIIKLLGCQALCLLFFSVFCRCLCQWFLREP